MEIYLIRHTTPAVKKGICYGQTDLDLANTFNEEARHVLRQLNDEFDVVYSSPLKRCVQLAKKISSKVVIENRLKELNFGDWEMKLWEEIPLAEIQPWYDDFVNTPCLKGESYQELADRVSQFFEELLSKDLKKVAIVSHSGVIRAILSHFNQVPLSDSFDKFTINYGEVIKLKIC